MTTAVATRKCNRKGCTQLLLPNHGEWWCIAHGTMEESLPALAIPQQEKAELFETGEQGKLL